MAVLRSVEDMPTARAAEPRDTYGDLVGTRAPIPFSLLVRDGSNSGVPLNRPVRAECGPAIGTGRDELAYLLCRSLRARRVIHFGASINRSTHALAAAMRDNGGGSIVCAGMAPENIESSRRDLADAGLLGYVEIADGSVLETLHELHGDIDFATIEGDAGDGRPSLALQAIRVIAPQMQGGAIVLANRADADYLVWVRRLANGFRSMRLAVDAGVELSVRIADDPV